jgi:hypothetical protein
MNGQQVDVQRVAEYESLRQCNEAAHRLVRGNEWGDNVIGVMCSKVPRDQHHLRGDVL